MMRGIAHGVLALAAAIVLCAPATAEGEIEGAPLAAESVEIPAPAEPTPDPVLDALDREFDRDEAKTRNITGLADQGSDEDPRELDGIYVFRVFGVLCFVLGLFLAIAYAARRYGGKTPALAGGQLGQVMGKLYISPKHSLVYVRSGGRVLLLGMTPASVSLVTEFDAESFDEQLNAGQGSAATPVNGVDFISQMRTATARMDNATAVEDTDLDSIRGDLQRLQQFLEESKHDGEG